jgi:hypothetical protein
MVRLPVASWMSSQVMHCPSVGLVGVPRVRLPWRVTRKWLPSAAFQRQEKDTDGIEKRCGAPAGPHPHPKSTSGYTRRSCSSSTRSEALRQESDGEGRRPHPPPLAGTVAPRGRLPLLRPLHPDRVHHAGPPARTRPERARVLVLRPRPPRAAAGRDRQPPPRTPTSPAAARPPGKEEQRRAEREAVAGEARRPVCAGCGRKRTDDRWERIEARGWDQPRESHPHLCEECQSRAVAAQQQTVADERERQEQERRRQEQETEQRRRRLAAGSPASAPDADSLPPTARASPTWSYRFPAAGPCPWPGAPRQSGRSVWAWSCCQQRCTCPSASCTADHAALSGVGGGVFSIAGLGAVVVRRHGERAALAPWRFADWWGAAHRAARMMPMAAAAVRAGIA